VTRYGGEEFAVILAGTKIEHASLIAENIRISIYDLNIPHEYSGVCSRVTVSAGIASMIPGKKQPVNVLIEAADKELYAAKEMGKNKVSMIDLLQKKQTNAQGN